MEIILISCSFGYIHVNILVKNLPQKSHLLPVPSGVHIKGVFGCAFRGDFIPSFEVKIN